MKFTKLSLDSLPACIQQLPHQSIIYSPKALSFPVMLCDGDVLRTLL